MVRDRRNVTEFLVRFFHRTDRPDFIDPNWPRPGARYEARE
ncbi:hypothetical protein [Kitasatospora sp. NPDC059817]